MISNQDTSLVTYSDSNDNEVQLSKLIIKRYICASATDQEMELFLRLCQYQRLNPFLRQAYLVKYGNQPATMVVGWHVFLERAETNPNFDGYEIEVYNHEDAPFRGRENEDILYATSKIYRKDRKYPTTVTVLFDEYAKRDSQGNLQSTWGKMKTTMIRKVALEQGLRETFTRDFQGLYGFEEMGIEVPVDETVNGSKQGLAAVPSGGLVNEPDPDEVLDDEVLDDLDDGLTASVRRLTERAPEVALGIPVPVIANNPKKAPFAVIAQLAKIHGSKWQQTGATMKLFGKQLKTTIEMQAFSVAEPERWAQGTQLLQEEVIRNKSS